LEKAAGQSDLAAWNPEILRNEVNEDKEKTGSDTVINSGSSSLKFSLHI
jgi:hypothetical protein